MTHPPPNQINLLSPDFLIFLETAKRAMAKRQETRRRTTGTIVREPSVRQTAKLSERPEQHSAGESTPDGRKASPTRNSVMKSTKNTKPAKTPAALEIAEEASALLAEANSNTQAMIDTINAIIRAETNDEVIRAALETIRKEFGWAYASYWTVDPNENVLVFAAESGRVDEEFHRLTRTARFKPGEGLNGRSWRLRDLVHVADLSELQDCCRAPLARRAGIKTAVALPILRDNDVIGTLDFFSTDGNETSPARLGALRTIGRLASDKYAVMARQGELTRIKQMVDNAPVNIMYADLGLKVRYMNPKAEQTLKRLEAHLPIKVDQIIGSSIDIFHKAPEYQQRLLADRATCHARERSTSARSCSSSA